MASNGVNVKMGVSGVAQFKQSMNQAKQSVKTLDAQLALSEKQFKATGDKQTYMAEQADLLKEKLEQQKAIVSQAERALSTMAANGIEKNSKAYQDMYRQMIQAKGAVLDTESALEGLAGGAGDADKNIGNVSGELQTLQSISKQVSFKTVTDGIDRITSGMENAAKRAWQLGAALAQEVLGAGSWADQLVTDAEVYGMTPEELQRAQKTALLIDTSVEAIVSAKKKMNKALGTDKDTEVRSIFAALGVDAGKSTSEEDKFWEIGEAIYHMADAEKQEAYAQKVFGRGWSELRPLFAAGREEYEKTNASWSVLNEQQLENLTKMDDQYQKLSAEFETFKLTLLESFSGPMTTAMEKLTAMTEQLNKYLESPEGQAALKQMGDTITQLIDDLIKVDPEDLVNGLKSVVDGLTESFKWIQEHSGDVVTAMEVIVGGWAALKVTGGALKMLELINGLKWMKLNPNIQVPGTSAAGSAAAGTVAGGSLWASLKSGAANFLKVAGPVAAGFFTLFENAFKEQGNDDILTKEEEDALLGRSDDEEAKARAEAAQAEYEAAVAEADAKNKEKLAAQAAAREARETDVRDLWGSFQTLAGFMDGLYGAKDNPLFDNYYDKLPEELSNELDKWYEMFRNGATPLDLAGNPAFSDFMSRLLSGYGMPTDGNSLMPESMASLLSASDKMYKTAEELSGGTNSQKQSSSEMTSAAGALKGMPAQVEQAILNGMSQIRIFIDGAQAGAVLSPYMATQMGGMVVTMTK